MTGRPPTSTTAALVRRLWGIVGFIVLRLLAVGCWVAFSMVLPMLMVVVLMSAGTGPMGWVWWFVGAAVVFLVLAIGLSRQVTRTKRRP